MKLITVLAVLAVLLLGFLFASGAGAEEPLDLFQLGQSYRTPMDMVEAFAEARGHDFRYRAYLPPGVSIYWHWARMDRTREMMADVNCRVLCLVPYYDFKEESPEGAAGFFGLALENNPDVRAYLVDHWPRRAMPMEEKEAWIEENQVKFELMAETANREHPDAAHPMRVVPRAAAFMDLLRHCDKIPGFTYPATAYNDGGHQSNTSNYMFAAMEYAWIFGESPLGLPNYAEKTRKGKTEALFDLTEQQALALQRLAWHHLTAHPTSGVEPPRHGAVPGTPQDIGVQATHEAVTLTWPEVERGPDVFKYLVKRSDGAEFSNVIAHFVDRTARSGRSYTYRVVAVDFAGNESDPSEPVRVDLPVDRVAPELAEVSADRTAETVRVIFDEPVAEETASESSNYRIEGLEVREARVADPKTVVLTTSAMTEGESYTLHVEDVADMATEPNVASELTAEFTFTPPVWTKFDLDNWDGTEIDVEGPQVRITARGKGGFRSWNTFDPPAMAGIYREMEGDFDVPLAITSQGQVAATTELMPYQRKGNVKTGFVLAENIEQIGRGSYATFYLDDSTRFRMIVHRNWLITARVIGAGLSAGDPRKNRQGLDLPVWLRFVREGSMLTGYYSLTGVGEDDWQKLGSIDAAKMAEKLQLGIFNMSGVEDEHSTAMFDLRATGEEKSYTHVGE